VNAPLNLLLAWLWILFGFLAGMLLGLFFHKENWLGGYTSLKRRMYRLAHISFFGLGAVNLLFVLTAREWLQAGHFTSVAGASFAAGAITMPACCVLMAHFPKSVPVFAVPVLSLVLGGALVVIQLRHI